MDLIYHFVGRTVFKCFCSPNKFKKKNCDRFTKFAVTLIFFVLTGIGHINQP